MLFYDYRVLYDLDAYVIMPDHFHVLIRPRKGQALWEVLQTFKGRSARFANLQIGRAGRVWFPRYLDRIARNTDDWIRWMQYLHDNPVRARLVKAAED